MFRKEVYNQMPTTRSLFKEVQDVGRFWTIDMQASANYDCITFRYGRTVLVKYLPKEKAASLRQTTAQGTVTVRRKCTGLVTALQLAVRQLARIGVTIASMET